RGPSLVLLRAPGPAAPPTPCRLPLPPATVEYAVPASFAFFGGEDRYSWGSDTVPGQVLPLPGAPATAGDPPAVARGLSLDLRLDPPNGRVGEPIAVTATLSGVGNVALWPEPVIAWPPGFRSYPGETATRIEARDGRIAGAKTFHYLVMPDSVGSFQMPAVRDPYYDLPAGG